MRKPPPAQIFQAVAPAKINWTLEVLGRRDDGYHEISSVMQTLSLEDELELRPASNFSLEISGREAGALTPHENLVGTATRLFAESLKKRPVAFSLKKQIPAAAGLGGGSSDAAAALRLLRRYWGMRDNQTLEDAAARLGSDVRFFLRGGMQLAEGRGEVLTPLPANEPVRIVLATPPIVLPDKTAQLYAKLKPSDFSAGDATAALASALLSGRSPVPEDYVNVFDRVADQVFPRIVEYRRLFARITGLDPMLAGAGPTVFAILPDRWRWQDKSRVQELLQRKGFKVWFVQTTGMARATRHEALTM